MPLVEMTEEQIAKRYLLDHNLVAIDFDLAKSEGGLASHLMIYDATNHRYLASALAKSRLGRKAA